MEIQRNKEWYVSLVQKMGTGTYSNRELRKLVDEVDAERGVEVKGTFHYSGIEHRLVKLGCEAIRDDSRKGVGREIPMIYSITDLDAVKEKLIRKGCTCPKTAVSKSKSVAEEAKASMVEAKEVCFVPEPKVEPAKLPAIPREDICRNVMKILSLAKDKEKVVIQLADIEKTIGKKVQKGTVVSWLDRVKKNLPTLQYENILGWGGGIKFPQPKADLLDLGRMSEVWYGKMIYPYKSALGIKNAKPAGKKEVVVVQPGDITPFEHDVIYLTAGILRGSGKGEAKNISDLEASVSKETKVHLNLNEYRAIIRKESGLAEVPGGMLKIKLANGDKSWQRIKKDHGPINLRQEVVFRLHESVSWVTSNVTSLIEGEVSVISRISAKDGIYKISFPPLQQNYGVLRSLFLKFREDPENPVDTGDTIIVGKDLYDKLIRDYRAAAFEHDNQSRRYLIDTEEWAEREALS